jgi:hypothetical protein
MRSLLADMSPLLDDKSRSLVDMGPGSSEIESSLALR